MAIHEKPSSASEIFASSKEALELGTPVIDISIAEFVDTLQQPEVQEVLQKAHGSGADE